MEYFNPVGKARRTRISKAVALLCIAATGEFAFVGKGYTQPPPAINPVEQDVTQGALRVKTEAGVVECPLKHTDVKASISGFIARVKVTQTFLNPYDEKIEAVYVFPLPHTAAVDDMTMVIGDRRIIGVIKRRAEARAIYEQALQQGLTAGLLEQERPNIFTQSVGNIKPRQEVRIEISYVDVLKYDMGTYEFHFPMVVGPRYIPGAPISKKPDTPAELKGKVGEVAAPNTGADPKGTGWSPDTNRVPDASRITPPVLKPGNRNGHDISLSVRLNAGVPIQHIHTANHKANLETIGASGAAVSLTPGDSIPNKDFVLRYNVVGDNPEMALLAHSKKGVDGYFMLMVQPKYDERLVKAPPRELVFLIDVSGSMRGAPTEKNKQIMREFFQLSKPNDTVQVITFASQAAKLFEKAVPSTPDNIARAMSFTEGIAGGGGTEMLKGIKMTLEDPLDAERDRIAIMLTDGYIGNEAEIIKEVGQRAGDRIRFWALGIGSSPNRFLIDGVAKQGGGMGSVVELNTDPTDLVRQIVSRIHAAQLSKIQINWKGLSVFETYPRRIPELWAGRPVILFGKYLEKGNAKIEISGDCEGKPLSYSLEVWLPSETPENEVLRKVWARQKIEDLSSQMFYGDTPEVVEEITRVALDYHLMSQYTSLVAVDESEARKRDEPAKLPRRMVVPVPIPEGVSFEGVFGADADIEARAGAPGAAGPQGSPGLAGVAQALTASPVRAKPPQRLGLKLSQRVVGVLYRSSSQRQFGGLGGGGFAGRGLGNGTPAKKEQPSYERYNARHVYSGGLTSLLGGSEARRDMAEDRAGLVRDVSATQLRSWFAPRHEEARKALTEAQELEKKGDFEAAVLRYQHALLLETAALFANPYPNDGTAVAATEALQKSDERITDSRSKDVPELSHKLDLVVRNQPLETALQNVCSVAGLKVRILPGSLADACELLSLSELRVTYLDLRRATVAQAFDWMLAPNHLSWRVEDKNTITVGTARRLAGDSAWVYAIGDLAIPIDRERADKGKPEIVAEALKSFVAVVRTAINTKDESGLRPGSAVFLDPARLLVYGDKDAHAKVGALLKALADPNADVEKVIGRQLPDTELRTLQELQKQTTARWLARTDDREKRKAALGRWRVINALDKSSWRLLAESCRGEVDPEALTELQVAWKSPRIKEVVEGSNGWVALRSAWVITRAARMVPRNEGLLGLADRALAAVQQQLPAVAKNLETKPNDIGAYVSALYSVLTLRNTKALRLGIDRDVIEKAATVEGLLLKENKAPQVSIDRACAASLLSPTPASDAALMAAISSRQIGGNDLVTLAFLAARQRGGNVWKTFREEMPDLTGSQPLDGNVILVLNRLGSLRLALQTPAE